MARVRAGRSERLFMLTLSVLALATLSALSGGDPREPQRCFRAVQSAERHAYLFLFHDGTYTRGEIDGSSIEWLDHGLWSEVSEDEYWLDSDVDAWSLETPYLSVSPKRLFNVPLVAQLESELALFLVQHPGQSKFSYDQVYVIAAMGGACLPGDRYVCRGPCDGPWRYGVNIQPKLLFPVAPINRKQLVELLEKIDAYVGRPDLNEFHMFLTRDSGFTLAYFDRGGVGYAFRAASRLEVLEELHNLTAFTSSEEDDFVAPGPLIEVTCEAMASDLELVGGRL